MCCTTVWAACAEEAQELVNNSKSVTEVTEGAAEHYDAIFLPGGHGIA